MKMTEKLPESSSVRRKKSFQGHQYRRRTKPSSEQYGAELSCVLGSIVKNNCAFACDEISGNVAFPAGCIIVIYQTREKSQFYIFNPGHKNLTCVQYSVDGQYLVTGESGHLPCVRVFSILERCQVASFQSHKFGISCVAFTPSMQYVVSIGYQHDNVINAWNWKKNSLCASNKVSTKVRAITFAKDSSYFVTVGNRHVKFWYLESSKDSDKSTVPLKGRSGILGSLRYQQFCDVSCGLDADKGFTFALTRSGMLCQFNDKRTLENSVQIPTDTAFCMCVVNGTISCGCSDGKVLLYSSRDLQIITCFSSSGLDSRLNDIIAIRMDSRNMWLHCVHSNHSLRVWDLLDLNNPTEHSASDFHSECVWDVKVYPPKDTSNSFITCSNDGTVRRWNFTGSSYVSVNTVFIDTSLAGNTSTEKDGKLGVRSLCISKDGKQVAIGDRNGVVHVYNFLDTPKEIAKIKLHGGDILDLDYCPTNNMLVSASRDRCIYMCQDHIPTYTINDHSAAVTAVKFVDFFNATRLISCGVDKSLYFCTVTSKDDHVEIVRDQHIVEKHAMHDMCVVYDTVLVACGASLREYGIENGKFQRSIRGSEAGATVVRVATNYTNTLISISCADKFVYILSYPTGDYLLELASHSEVCTALSFMNDKSDQCLISASADSCIFVWKLKRCTSDESTIHPVSQIETPIENEKQISNGINMSGYFGDLTLNSSLLIQDVPLNERNGEIVNGKHATDTDDENVKSKPLFSIDEDKPEISLPTWITGKKDRSIKNQVPGGKWASRLQERYTDVVMLDTPRCQPDWEISQREHCENETETDDSSEDGEESPENLELERKCNDASIDQEKSKTDEETDESKLQVPESICEMKTESDIETKNLNESSILSSTISTDYASAVDDSNDNIQAPCTNSSCTQDHQSPVDESSRNNNNIVSCDKILCTTNDEVEIKIHDVVDNMAENEVDSTPVAKVAIPPAFANFLENLSKKKQRFPPTSLSVRKAYEYNSRDMSGSEERVLHDQQSSESAPVKMSSLDITVKECERRDEERHSIEYGRDIVNQLLSAYERAEILYKKISSSSESAEDQEISKLLSKAFTSLLDRIHQLQGNIPQVPSNKNVDINHLSPVMELLREYSDKLIVMVKDEVQENLIKH